MKGATHHPPVVSFAACRFICGRRSNTNMECTRNQMKQDKNFYTCCGCFFIDMVCCDDDDDDDDDDVLLSSLWAPSQSHLDDFSSCTLALLARTVKKSTAS
mmetsp:Transcript_14990/g.21967  ORF Transcript_14990/g.21967 Transcript_14990/m.21967 type:complete len:101 (-) Transcript_14990:139-441(-)